MNVIEKLFGAFLSLKYHARKGGQAEGGGSWDDGVRNLKLVVKLRNGEGEPFQRDDAAMGRPRPVPERTRETPVTFRFSLMLFNFPRGEGMKGIREESLGTNARARAGPPAKRIKRLKSGKGDSSIHLP